MKTSGSSDNKDDQALITLINRGDDDAFEKLYLRHRDWVFRMACRVTGNEHLAQDVLQEVFCYFLGKFPGFELRCEIRTFFYPVIRNLSLTSLRKFRRLAGGEIGETHLKNLPAPKVDCEPSQDFTEIISALSSDHREILLLRFVDGMTLPEIAEIVGIPPGTAKSRLHHALASLRKKSSMLKSEID